MYTCYRSSAVNHLLQKFLYDIYCYLDVLLLQHSTCMVDTFIDEWLCCPLCIYMYSFTKIWGDTGGAKAADTRRNFHRWEGSCWVSVGVVCDFRVEEDEYLNKWMTCNLLHAGTHLVRGLTVPSRSMPHWKLLEGENLFCSMREQHD